jgi:ribosomal protein S18 acetylase RimI-like enzyme
VTVVDHIRVRAAREGDTDAIVSIVNEAYLVEAFFVAGDRTHPAEVRDLIRAGQCYVADDGGRVVACVEVAAHDGRGYFGMLAVSPAMQGRGLGRRLIGFAEDTARAAGSTLMDIKVVSVRGDLVKFYESLGYGTTGTEPYVHRPVLMPCHFVTMTKRL